MPSAISSWSCNTAIIRQHESHHLDGHVLVIADLVVLHVARNQGCCSISFNMKAHSGESGSGGIDSFFKEAVDGD